MNLDTKITAAVRCLEREYPDGVDATTLDAMIAEIRRDHRHQFRQSVLARFKSLADVYVKVAQLMHAERLGLRPQSLNIQH